MSLTLSAMDNGSWVVFELPGFAPRLRVRNRAVWMRCAPPVTPRTTTTKTHFGSRSLSQGAVAAAVAVAAETASRSAGKLNPAV